MRLIVPADLSSHLRNLLLSVLLVFLAACAETPEGGVPHPDMLQRQNYSDVRVMSWNVKLTSILPPDGVRQESFARIVQAIDPDVIGLQEVMLPDQAEVLAQLMNRYVPLDKGGSWQVHTVADNALISRFPLHQRGGELVVRYPYPELELPDFHYGYAAALIDIPDYSGGTDMYVVAMHNKSGDGEENVRLRQLQSDVIASWLRDIRKPGHTSFIPEKTPIVILGDMNVVPSAPMRPFETLLSGDIADEESFGPDFRVDWDDSDMADARPSHNELGRDFYTWRNDNLPFEPSALDRIIFTDSVMSIRRRFVLNTMTMLPNDLENHRLKQTDVLFGGDPGYYDHLPLIVDFAIGLVSSK